MRKNTNPTYTIDVTPIGDHLQVHIPELNVTVQTEPGKTSIDDAFDVAHVAIIQHDMAERKSTPVKAAS